MRPRPRTKPIGTPSVRVLSAAATRCSGDSCLCPPARQLLNKPALPPSAPTTTGALCPMRNRWPVVRGRKRGHVVQLRRSGYSFPELRTATAETANGTDVPPQWGSFISGPARIGPSRHNVPNPRGALSGPREISSSRTPPAWLGGRVMKTSESKASQLPFIESCGQRLPRCHRDVIITSVIVPRAGTAHDNRPPSSEVGHSQVLLAFVYFPLQIKYWHSGQRKLCGLREALEL